MVTNNHHTNNSTTSYTNNNSGNVSSNPFKRLFRLSKDHQHHHHNHHHMSHHQSNLHHDKHVEEEVKYETSSCTCCQHIETVENIIIKEETIEEDYLPSSSSVISSFTMLNSNNKRRFSMTNHGSISSQIISSTNDKNANEKKKEKKRKLKKQNKILHFFKGHATTDSNINQTNTTTASTTSNQLIEPSESKLNKSKSIELDFDFNIVDKPITSNTCYMTNCLTTSSVDYSTNNNTFSSTNVNNNNTTTTTYETPLDRILLLNEVTKLTSPLLSKNISPPNNQLQRGKALKVTSNENLFFLQPLKSKNSSISTGDKRRRVGDDNSESMILSDGISPTNSFTVLSDEPMVTSPKLDQSFVEEFL